MDYCGWVSSPPAGVGVDWDWLSGGGRFVPSVDHTTNSALGTVGFLSSPNTLELIIKSDRAFIEFEFPSCFNEEFYCP